MFFFFLMLVHRYPDITIILSNSPVFPRLIWIISGHSGDSRPTLWYPGQCGSRTTCRMPWVAETCALDRRCSKRVRLVLVCVLFSKSIPANWSWLVHGRMGWTDGSEHQRQSLCFCRWLRTVGVSGEGQKSPTDWGVWIESFRCS